MLPRFFILFLLLLNVRLLFGNPLESLVFDLTTDLRTTMPADGWLKLSFNVVNYDNLHLTIKFNAVCVETGKALPFYPHTGYLQLGNGEEQKVTVFMDEDCGWNEKPEPGRYKRTIRFELFEINTQEKLVFEQSYDIEIKSGLEEASNVKSGF